MSRVLKDTSVFSERGKWERPGGGGRNVMGMLFGTPWGTLLGKYSRNVTGMSYEGGRFTELGNVVRNVIGNVDGNVVGKHRQNVT